MRLVDLLTRTGRWAALVIRTALAIGLLPVASAVTGGVGLLKAAPSGQQALEPTGAEVDGEAFRISVPPTWRRLQDDLTVMFAPEDGYGQFAGKAHVVYGVELGVKRTMRPDPSGAFDDVVQAFRSIKPTFVSASTTRSVKLAGRFGLRNTFSSTSLVTGRPEFVIVAAAPVELGRALYVVGVAPQEQWEASRQILEAILLSIEKARGGAGTEDRR